jgi:hypothetical protein
MNNILLILITALQLADGWTTYKILSDGGRELNTRMRKGIEQYGLIPALVIYKGIIPLVIIITYFLVPSWLIWILYPPLIILYGWFVWRNWRQLQ